MLVREDTEIRHQAHARPRFSDSDSGLICDLSATGRTTTAHHTSGAARGRGIRRPMSSESPVGPLPALPRSDETIAVPASVCIAFQVGGWFSSSTSHRTLKTQIPASRPVFTVTPGQGIIFADHVLSLPRVASTLRRYAHFLRDPRPISIKQPAIAPYEPQYSPRTS